MCVTNTPRIIRWYGHMRLSTSHVVTEMPISRPCGNLSKAHGRFSRASIISLSLSLSLVFIFVYSLSSERVLADRRDTHDRSDKGNDGTCTNITTLVPRGHWPEPKEADRDWLLRRKPAARSSMYDCACVPRNLAAKFSHT